ncbi:MAG TPA: sigma-70 family RNA polymerase sigma factor [Luteolibacter sp.]|nr:sigma-70 family RNA polymerase sigma factor [Luteolibacter sp.]
MNDDSLQLQEFVTEITNAQGRIRAFIVSLMPGSQDVGDVLQETNLTLWKSRARYQPGTNFLAWAFTIARLEVLHQRSRDKRLGRIVLSDKLVEIMADEASTGIPHESYLRALETCMAKLTTKQRQLVEARYQPGHSLEMHAHLTGKKSSALRVALLRIRSGLRQCVEQNMTGQTA